MKDPYEARILIVDDERVNIVLLQRLLAKSGYRNVLATADPQEVPDLWETFTPDLLLLDLMMPHLDGFEVMDRIGANGLSGSGRYVPILVLTADATPRTRDRALAAGAKDFLTKPFDHTEVRLRIANLLETRALHVRLSEANRTLEDRVAKRTRELRGSLERVYQAHERLHQAHDELEESRRQTIHRLSIAAELRDDDTGHHIHRMSTYVRLIAGLLGHDDAQREMIELASQMHDVGKIGIPDAVLLKPGRLTAEERVIIERHPEIGYQILRGSDSDLLQLAASIALTHHERMDGRGYPRGLKGDDIPLEGRIAAIADVFDALTSDRVYRRAMPVDQAVQIMRDARGSQFDADLLDRFLAALPEVLAVKVTVERPTMEVDRASSGEAVVAVAGEWAGSRSSGTWGPRVGSSARGYVAQ